MVNQEERARTDGKCRVLKNPNRIVYEKNGRKEFLILEYLLYSSIPKLEEVFEELKDSVILEELEAMEKCKQALEKLKSRNVHNVA